MAELKITYSNNAKNKMQEAYSLQGQELADEIIKDLEKLIKKKLRIKRDEALNIDFSFNE